MADIAYRTADVDGETDTTRSLPMSLLSPGDTYPELTFTVPGGTTVTVPDTFAGQLIERYAAAADARRP